VIARRHGRHALYALIALAGCALAPAAASASSGGGGGGLTGSPIAPADPTGTSPGTTGTAPTVRVPTGSGNRPVSTSGNGVTLTTVASSLLRHRLSISGTAASAAGREIEIERAGRQTDWAWQEVAAVPVASDGAFTASWLTNQPGRFALRAQVVDTDNLASAAATTPALTVTVYRQARATLYGPGFYGHRTACGDRLTRTTIGVANRTLRCGSTVSILYKGVTVSVPVIDRGPYANGADWDLTTATAAAIGMEGTEEIGAVALPRVPPAARRASGRSPAPVLVGAQ
jgi:rare lipoprotein A